MSQRCTAVRAVSHDFLCAGALSFLHVLTTLELPRRGIHVPPAGAGAAAGGVVASAVYTSWLTGPVLPAAGCERALACSSTPLGAFPDGPGQLTIRGGRHFEVRQVCGICSCQCQCHPSQMLWRERGVFHQQSCGSCLVNQPSGISDRAAHHRQAVEQPIHLCSQEASMQYGKKCNQ